MDIGLNMTSSRYFAATNFRCRFSSLQLSSHSQACALLLFFVMIFSLQLSSKFNWRVRAPPVGSSMRTLRTSTGRPQCGDNLIHPCHPTEPKKNGPIGDICKDFVRGATCMPARYHIGCDGGGRSVDLCGRRKVFANIDSAFNSSVLRCAICGGTRLVSASAAVIEFAAT